MIIVKNWKGINNVIESLDTIFECLKDILLRASPTMILNKESLALSYYNNL